MVFPDREEGLELSGLTFLPKNIPFGLIFLPEKAMFGLIFLLLLQRIKFSNSKNVH